MYSYIDLLIRNLEQKEKIIVYLNTLYKIESGTEAIIPNAYINKDFTEENESKIIYLTFREKVDDLNLPTIMDKNIKQKITKLKQSNDSKFLIRHLNISGYAEKGFELPLFKRVLEGIQILKSVEDINLRNNNLNDNYADSICELFNLDSLKRIDISYNNLSIAFAKKLINAIKSNDRLEYLDVSYNPFNSDYYSCSTICNSMRQHVNLFHFGISDSTRDSAIKVLSYLPCLRSLNLDDNKYGAKSVEYLSKFLVNKKYQLSVLSLKFSSISVLAAGCIEKALALNKTLVYVNLYSCGVSDLAGARIISSLEMNKYLVDIDLGANRLGEEFCKKFGKVLKINKIINKVNLSKNYDMVDSMFANVLDGLIHNQSVTSLGDLSVMKIGVKIRESVEIILNMNKEFLENQIPIRNDIAIDNKNESAKKNLIKWTTDFEKVKLPSNDQACQPSNHENEDEAESKIKLKYNIRFHYKEEDV